MSFTVGTKNYCISVTVFFGGVIYQSIENFGGYPMIMQKISEKGAWLILLPIMTGKPGKILKIDIEKVIFAF